MKFRAFSLQSFSLHIYSVKEKMYFCFGLYSEKIGMKHLGILLCFLFAWNLYAQEQELNTLYQKKTIYPPYNAVEIIIDSLPLNNTYFFIENNKAQKLPSTRYTVDFNKAIIKLDTLLNDTLQIYYLRLPSALTQTYSLYSKNQIIPDQAGKRIFAIPEKKSSDFIPFDGLSTDGSITRGITIGSNQNLVANSNLDLQITGKLSDDVQLRASIQDSNVPLQNGGYSQRIDEFDQIFIEVLGKNWHLRAGDLFLENRKSRFLNFNKKIQGIYASFSQESKRGKTVYETAAAIARGQYAKSEFVGQEGNQGPYKLKGANQELYILIVSGSERVFVNGRQLTRGEANDYVIDYNSGEIRFTSLFPIAAEMRISVEYQYTERNYTRFLSYGAIKHQRNQWEFSGFVYTESDVKSRPLQQNLSKTQIEVLQNAGNDPQKMYAENAYIEEYSPNKVLYRKVVHSNGYYYEYSTNPQDELYMVSFNYVGTQNGNYILKSTAGIAKIFEYVEPINGVLQGDYEPVSQLVAPMQTVLATAQTKYSSEKTNAEAEIAWSNFDQNLFSTIDDQQNKGWASHLQLHHKVIDKQWKVNLFSNVQFVHRNFKPLERLYQIEFDRDWNLEQAVGNQFYATIGAEMKTNPNNEWKYQVEKLNIARSYTGIRQILKGNYKKNNLEFTSQNSWMQAESTLKNTSFFRSASLATLQKNKYKTGVALDVENYQIKDKTTLLFDSKSQKYLQIDAFVRRGDSLQNFVQLGYKYRINDSLQNNELQRVANAHTWYAQSQLLKKEKQDFNIYTHYRVLQHKDQNPNEKTLNTRMVYNTRFFDNNIQWSTIYETSSGAIAQQEFTYIEVEPGLGTHMWNDYNQNGQQELEEFEIAPYPDLAKYVRLFLPNQVFVRIFQQKFTQLLNLHFPQWQNEKGWKKIASKLHSQTAYLLDKSVKRDHDDFALAPWGNNDNLLTISEDLKTSLYFNKSLRRYSTNYSYIENRVRNYMNFGSAETQVKTHQLQLQHLVKKLYNYQFFIKKSAVHSFSEHYGTKNYILDIFSYQPKIAYLFSTNASLDVFYEFQEKKNKENTNEYLKQHRLGLSFMYNTNERYRISGEWSFYQNNFSGQANSAIGYRMLEGLQPGKNMTWRLTFQRNITKYLDANILYQGRSSENAPTIHTGSIQLRAFF